jgi:hypothetical protein
MAHLNGVYNMAYGASGGAGLQPLNSGNGVTFNGITNQYNLPATGGQSIFQGDPVALSTVGVIVRGSASAPALGAFQGCEFQDTSGVWQFVNYFSGATSFLAGNVPTAMVIDDPMAQYTITEGDSTGASGTPLTAAAPGLNANFVYTAGSTRTGISAVTLNNSTASSASGLNMRIVSLDSRTGNAVGAFANWVVQINNGQRSAGTPGHVI